MAAEQNTTEEVLGSDAPSPAVRVRDAIVERHGKLAALPPAALQRAWTIAAHLLLPRGARVAVMGCGDGTVACALAILRPGLRFLAVDPERRRISRARALYRAHNLQFEVGQGPAAMVPPFAAGALDAVVSDHALHGVYSRGGYTTGAALKELATGMGLLKEGGLLFVHDYLAPSDGYVYLDLADVDHGPGDAPEDLSDTAFLEWFSERAGPGGETGCGGFFLEPVACPTRGRARYRLPARWAAEFLLRREMGPKDRAKALDTAHTAMTAQEMREALTGLGARLVYSAPRWAPPRKKDEGSAAPLLFAEDGAPLAPPPVGFVAVAQKVGMRASLSVAERRPAAGAGAITIQGVKNAKTGETADVASRGAELVHDVLPWRIDADSGRLQVYLHDGLARGIANTAPRSGANIDDKRWSGHMLAPITLPTEAMAQALGALEGGDGGAAAHTLAIGQLGLHATDASTLDRGPELYPAPDHILEKAQAWFLEVEAARGPVLPPGDLESRTRFHARGPVRAFDAQGVLDAIAAGLVPNAQMEIALLTLFARLDIPAESGNQGALILHAIKINEKKGLREFLDAREEVGDRFVGTASATGSLRAVHSVFVEEGRGATGAAQGLAAQDMGFVVPEGRTVNTAVVLPLTDNAKGQIHAMLQADHLPAPQRMDGSATVWRLPSFPLPEEVATLDAARAFVAERMHVLPEQVIELGPSYYTHIGMTPQRVFPFGVSQPPAVKRGQGSFFVPMSEIMLLWPKLKDQNTMVALARGYKMFADTLRLEMKARSVLMRGAARANISEFLPTLDLPEIVRSLPGQGRREFKSALDARPALASAWSSAPPTNDAPSAPEPEAEEPDDPDLDPPEPDDTPKLER